MIDPSVPAMMATFCFSAAAAAAAAAAAPAATPASLSDDNRVSSNRLGVEDVV
jgi:hypothetical protein